MSTDTPPNLPAHELHNPAAVIEELMYVPPNTQQEHRRVGGKAVTILPRPSAVAAMKQTTASPQLNGQVLAAAQAQAIVAASQPLATSPAPQPQPPNGPAAAIKCQTNKLGSRKMTHEIEEEVLANWGEHVSEYYEGIRRRVFKKIALKLNEMLQEEPFYTEKQVENKITYMEKRYKSVKDKFSASGFGVEDLTERSMRTQVERMFPLFFKVHNIIGRRATISPVAALATTAATAVDLNGTDLNGQGINLAVDSSAANRVRKRKRASSSPIGLDANKSDPLLTSTEPPVPDVPVMDESDDMGDPADVIESDDSPKDNDAKKRKKQITSDLNKRANRKKIKTALTGRASAAETMLRVALKQVESDERQRKEIVQVMRTELQFKQMQMEAEKKSAQDRSAMSKAIELRKLAELYEKIDDKESVKQLLDESYELLSKLR